MNELLLPPKLSAELESIYEDIVTEYDIVAQKLPLSCEGCPDNCCDSYFQHHTYCEWAYLWEGLRELDKELFNQILSQAESYDRESKALLKEGKRPQLRCPLLLETGLCGLYKHRLLICRTHGVPATLLRPDGQYLRFPGCFRCQEIVHDTFSKESEAPAMDRTGVFRKFAKLEADFLGNIRHLYPRVKLTIAEMIVKGPPQEIQSCLKEPRN